MKSLTAAAVVAGSMAIAGAATPAHAHNTADLTRPSLTGAMETTPENSLDVVPMRHQSNELDTENKDSVLHAVKGTTTSLNSRGGPTQLLGGLPLQR
ncbi:hypothetical protein SGFS_075260 [Streptomyces graminofaciens]|uniref:Secreted protein n=1 Tax=Streptomyces graminofaciens TaxID=68212 RepID=A0ABM7FGP3_9ACTN|nr:hypothetical protein [Streptomyces graminofaciens]BBC36232.1 hypothetical protein SGFS_075260 [Streptomyces graminofaciens]